MMKWIVLLFLKKFTTYFEVQILAIYNNYVSNVGMNCSVKFAKI
jgi:hypothetical protein